MICSVISGSSQISSRYNVPFHQRWKLQLNQSQVRHQVLSIHRIQIHHVIIRLVLLVIILTKRWYMNPWRRRPQHHSSTRPVDSVEQRLRQDRVLLQLPHLFAHVQPPFSRRPRLGLHRRRHRFRVDVKLCHVLRHLLVCYVLFRRWRTANLITKIVETLIHTWGFVIFLTQSFTENTGSW